MPVLRYTLTSADVTRSTSAESEGAGRATWKQVTRETEDTVDDEATPRAELNVNVQETEELDMRHGWNWDKRDEQGARAEKERIARMRRVAWCDFCGNYARERRCCDGCKKIGVMTYYCDRGCQVAAWRLQPKHRCGN